MIYHFRRVIVSFTLCPTLVVILVFSDVAKTLPLYQEGSMNLLETFIASLWLGMVTAMIGMFFYGIPAFCLALLYAYLRLNRCFQHILFVCVAGGLGAQLWCEVLSLETISNRYTSFFLGAATSLLMAFYALPKQPKIQE